MKKIVTVFAFTAALSSVLLADFARIELGAGAWMQEPKGGITADGAGFTGDDTAIEDDTTQAYVWLLIKHPVPVVPNLRLEYVEVSSDGLAEGTFKDFTAPANTRTSLDMTQYDVIPYYNILDNTFWITLDLGLDIKVMDVSYEAQNVTGYTSTNYTESKTVALPLGYARARVEIPATDVGLEADVKYIKYSENTAYDVRAKIDYTFDISPVIQPAVEVGYRVQKYKVDELSDIKLDIEFAGFYAGAMLRF